MSKFIFFSQNQSKDFFFQNIPGPPEYQMDRALAIISQWNTTYMYYM